MKSRRELKNSAARRAFKVGANFSQNYLLRLVVERRIMKPTDEVKRQRKRSGPFVFRRSDMMQTVNRVSVAKP